MQCVQKKVVINKKEIADVKQRKVAYCTEGYHSFRSVEHSGLRDLLQTFADLGAKYGEFYVNDVMFGRNVVSRETYLMSLELKASVKEALKSPVAAGTVALSGSVYRRLSEESVPRHTCYVGN